MVRYLISAILGFGVPLAIANPIDLTTYNISFTGGGILPTSGSFTYDPDVPNFTAFSVTWDGLVFDLTSAANAPTIGSAPPCLNGQTGAAATFLLLTACQPPDTGYHTQWNAQAIAGVPNALFAFDSFVISPPTTGIFVGTSVPEGQAPNVNPVNGAWTVTVVPEPSAAFLNLIGLVGLGTMVLCRKVSF